jgi:hypothetical protein
MTDNKFDRVGWFAVFGVAAAVVVLAELFHLSEKVENISVSTAILFVALIFSYQTRWNSMSFWRNLGVVFLVHTAVVATALQHFQNIGISGLAMAGITLAEGMVIVLMLDFVDHY